MSVSPDQAVDTSTGSPVMPQLHEDVEDNDHEMASSSDARENDAPLVDEYNKWRQTDRQSIKLRETRTDVDGKTSLEFSIEASEQRFTLHCPPSYPDYSSDDNFFVEADSGLQLWCNALNEYLLDTDGQLSLEAILNKGLSLYSSADASKSSGGARSRRGSSNMNEDEDEYYDEAADMDDDEEDPGHAEDEQLEDILDNDLSWELELSRRKKRWRIKEEQLRMDKLRNSDSGLEEERSLTLQQLLHDPSIKARQPKQVFTSAAASGILTNDLVSIMESADITGIEADTVDDNIFQWNVKVRNFSTNCVLDKDFQELQALHGYDYIELQLDFSMDLYPFFPPLVKVIRPRLQGSMMLRVTTMEILRLSYWNPARDMKSVLVDIKAFLQTWARLDLQSERNDRRRYTDGAYIDIEHHLLRLALVSEIVPRANKKYMTAPPPPVTLPLTAMVATASDNSVKKKDDSSGGKQKSKFILFGMNKDKSDGGEESEKKESSQPKNMAKGVGYSSYQQKGWDVKAYMAAQREKDKQIELVLAKIYMELKKLHGSHQLSARNLPDLIDSTVGGASGQSPPSSDEVESRINSNRGSRRKRGHSPDEATGVDVPGAVGGAAVADCTAAAPIDPLSDLYAVLEGSALVPFLESKLQANSFLEICSHTNVYKCVVNIIREIVSQPCLLSLLGPLPDQKNSLHSLLLSLEGQARILLDKIGKASANGSVPKSGKASEKVTDKTSDDKLARDFLSLSKEVTQALKNTGFLPDINGDSLTGGGSTEAAGSGDSTDVNNSNANNSDSHHEASPDDPQPGPSGLQDKGEPRKKVDDEASFELYKNYMRTIQFDSCEFTLTGSQAHAFAPAFQKAGSPSSQIIFRVAQELSSLSTSLPLDFSSAIFLRTDDDRATLLKVIITGPEETPYSGGCYQFDFYFPPKYPSAPPHVNFRTTGGGAVRFNPNLYNCGKVCLSLLGTWEGAQGEQWNETSTILQVLISIQSLILCTEPYYNEPGFERLYGTPQGDGESLKYSEDVFRNNLKYAVLGQLQNPPEGFEDIIRAHFYLKRDFLIKEYEKMTEKYKSKEVKKQFLEVRRELMKLEAPPGLKKITSINEKV